MYHIIMYIEYNTKFHIYIITKLDSSLILYKVILFS